MCAMARAIVKRGSVLWPQMVHYGSSRKAGRIFLWLPFNVPLKQYNFFGFRGSKGKLFIRLTAAISAIYCCWYNVSTHFVTWVLIYACKSVLNILHYYRNKLLLNVLLFFIYFYQNMQIPAGLVSNWTHQLPTPFCFWNNGFIVCRILQAVFFLQPGLFGLVVMCHLKLPYWSLRKTNSAITGFVINGLKHFWTTSLITYQSYPGLCPLLRPTHSRRRSQIAPEFLLLNRVAGEARLTPSHWLYLSSPVHISTAHDSPTHCCLEHTRRHQNSMTWPTE